MYFGPTTSPLKCVLLSFERLLRVTSKNITPLGVIITDDITVTSHYVVRNEED